MGNLQWHVSYPITYRRREKEKERQLVLSGSRGVEVKMDTKLQLQKMLDEVEL